MKKLGLCVRYDCDNYGSMLQIFATQKAIIDAGWKYEHIRYDKKTLIFLLKNSTRIFNPYFMRGKIIGFQKANRLKKHPEIQQNNAKRQEMIGAFRKKYITPYSPVYRGFSNLVKGAGAYDAIMVGSDQLWTPAGIKSKFYNLLFVPDDIPKIAFATSFGVSEIPNSQTNETARYLQRINSLSVREKQGAEIVRKLTGREAVVALDPTLLYTGEEWKQFFSPKREVGEKYIFAFFLGANAEHRKAVSKLAEQTGLKIVTCPFMNEFVEIDMLFGDIHKYDVGPVEFLNLIRGAEYICTDSFHGSVFSILNHKQFLTFNRFDDAEKQSKNSRIDSLFSLLGLESRRFSKNVDICTTVNAEINYRVVDDKLEELRKKTLSFLENALKEAENDK